jgi:hypothetical protein
LVIAVAFLGQTFQQCFACIQLTPYTSQVIVARQDRERSLSSL